jgi:hypothetical protein
MSFFTVVGVLITSSCLTSSVRSAMATSVTTATSTKDESEVIVIGGSQSSTENYISMPNTEEVPVSFSEYPVYAYDQNSNSDMHAEFWKTNKECPGGGHDCLYTEKVENGRVTGITDKDGNDLIQQFVDDLYDGKLVKLDEMIEEKGERLQKTRKLSDDNKVMMKMGEEWKEVEPNKQYTMEHGSGSSSWTQTIELPVGQYLLILMMLYKMTGKPKPRVVIDLPAKKRET